MELELMHCKITLHGIVWHIKIRLKKSFKNNYRSKKQLLDISRENVKLCWMILVVNGYLIT